MRKAICTCMATLVLGVGPWKTRVWSDAVGDAFIAWLNQDRQGAMDALETGLKVHPGDTNLLRVKSLLEKRFVEDQIASVPNDLEISLQNEMSLLLQQHAEVLQVLEEVKGKMNEGPEMDMDEHEKLAGREQAIRLANERIVVLEETLSDLQTRIKTAPSTEDMAGMEMENRQLIKEVDQLTQELAQERARIFELQAELQETEQRMEKTKGEEESEQLRSRIADLERENATIQASLESSTGKRPKRSPRASVPKSSMETSSSGEQLVRSRAENEILKKELKTALERAIRAEKEIVNAQARVKILESKLAGASGTTRSRLTDQSESNRDKEIRSMRKALDQERSALHDAENQIESLKAALDRLSEQLVTGDGLSMDSLQERIDEEDYERARIEALWLFGQDPRNEDLRRLIIRLTDVVLAVQ